MTPLSQLLGLNPVPAEPPKKLDAKEVMKKRREKAICIVSYRDFLFLLISCDTKKKIWAGQMSQEFFGSFYVFYV